MRKKGKMMKFLFLLLGIILVLAYLFTQKNKNKDDGPMTKDSFIEEVEDNVDDKQKKERGDTIDDKQKEILENIESHPYKKGVYIYKVEGETYSVDEYVFVSGDDRSLAFPSPDQFELSDGKTYYFASEKYKNYFKRDADKMPENLDREKLDYEIFFDYDGSLIDGFDIRQDGNSYIVENNKYSYVFDDQYVLKETTGHGNGEKYVKKLVKYDEDFDSYYDKYLELLKSYEEVEDVNLVSPKE